MSYYWIYRKCYSSWHKMNNYNSLQLGYCWHIQELKETKRQGSPGWHLSHWEWSAWLTELLYPLNRKSLFVSTMMAPTLFEWPKVQRLGLLQHPCVQRAHLGPRLLAWFLFFLQILCKIFIMSFLTAALLYTVSMTENESNCFLKCMYYF